MDKSIERIKEMEEILNNSIKTINDFESALDAFLKAQIGINKVSKYYGSENWFNDIEEYDSGKVHKDVKAGILSEDMAYDMLMNNRELAIRMLEVGTEILKKG